MPGHVRYRRTAFAAGALAAALTVGTVTPAMAYLYVDSVVVSPSSSSNDNTPDFAGYMANAFDFVTIFIDGEPSPDIEASESTGFWSYSGPTLADGPHTWSVERSAEAFGGGSFTVDTTVATPDVTASTTVPTEGDRVTFSISHDSDAVGWLWGLDLGDRVGLNEPEFAIPSIAGVGAHTVSVSAVDTLGNVSEPQFVILDVQARVAPDTTAPVVSLLSAPPAESTSRTATFTWSATDVDTDLLYYWQLDDEAEHFATDLSWVYAGDPGLSIGQHTFAVRAQDSAGNMSTSVVYAFTVLPPVTPPAAPSPTIAWVTQPGSSTSTSARFVVAVPSGAQVEYVLDLPAEAQSADPIPVGSDFTLTGLSVGHHRIQVGATLDGAYSEILAYEWDVVATAPAEQVPTPAAQAPVLTVDAIPAAAISRGVRSGASGPSVAIIQTVVGADADGRFGSRTRAAVMAFQRSHGLYADGIVGPLTWAAIVDVANGGAGLAPVTATSIPRAQILRGIARGTFGPSVSVVQHALGTSVTGRFDARTTAAVRAFQRQHGLVADGIVGPLTWRVLVS